VRQTIDRRIDMELDLADGLPRICADVAQINAVLMNLCINARDAINRILEDDVLPERSGERFIITMKTDMMILAEGEYQKDVHAKPGTYVVFSVTDNGIGMEEDTKKRIFEPFYTTKNTVGTGLGLASAFGSVKQHNGWIDFTSEYGIGTTFTIYLPAIDDEKIERREDSDASESADDALRGNECILIVDDEDMILSLGQEILEECGYKVIQARDGEEGWNIYDRNRERIDLILLDLSMPKMSGQELLKQIRLNDSKVKIIISSGYAESVDMQALTKMGADGVISKPYYPQNLIHEVRRFLDDKI
jgi:two-component system, cell cycle sensor histidine kinase and response regulator CckA